MPPGTASAVAAARVKAVPRARFIPSGDHSQRGIDVYTTDNCGPESLWQQYATNEMRGIKSLGANNVDIVFPFYTTGPTANSVFAADLCGEPEAIPVPLQSPSPARLAVLVHAAQLAGLHVLLRPLLDQSNIYIFGDWRGDIEPTNEGRLDQSYESVLKPYLEMAQANKVTRFVISSELTSLSTSSQWPSAIASAKKLYSGQLVFDSSWVKLKRRRPCRHRGRTRRISARYRTRPPPHQWPSSLPAGTRTSLAVPFAAPAAKDTFEEVGINAVDGAYADAEC